GPGEKPAVPRHGVARAGDQPPLLIGIEERRLPGRPGDDDPVVASLQQLRDVLAERSRSDVAGGRIERCGDRGEHAAEATSAHDGGSMLDRLSVMPAGLSLAGSAATTPAGAAIRARRRGVFIFSSKSAGLDDVATAVSYLPVRSLARSLGGLSAVCIAYRSGDPWLWLDRFGARFAALR